MERLKPLSCCTVQASSFEPNPSSSSTQPLAKLCSAKPPQSPTITLPGEFLSTKPLACYNVPRPSIEPKYPILGIVHTCLTLRVQVPKYWGSRYLQAILFGHLDPSDMGPGILPLLPALKFIGSVWFRRALAVRV